jgi:hypothetical protein
MKIISKLPCNRICNDLATWPNTTFAIVSADFGGTRVTSEGVLIGSSLVLTLAGNLFQHGHKTNNISVGVSWDGISEDDISEANCWYVSELHQLSSEYYREDFAIIGIKKDFSEKYGYLGLSSPSIFNKGEYFVYAFDKNKKSSVIPIQNVKIDKNHLIYDLIPTHKPIVGAAIMHKINREDYNLIGMHLGDNQKHNYGLFISEEQIAQVENFRESFRHNL